METISWNGKRFADALHINALRPANQDDGKQEQRQKEQ